MNVDRHSHSSTCLNDSLYVFGGSGSTDRSAETIERLLLIGQSGVLWELISTDAFTPRKWASVCPIDEYDILICGGYDEKAPKFLSDAIVFNTVTKYSERIA